MDVIEGRKIKGGNNVDKNNRIKEPESQTNVCNELPTPETPPKFVLIYNENRTSFLIQK